jgi:IMP dehydrogenase
LTIWDKARKIVGMDLLEYVRGCTFDDFLLTPQRGVLPRRDPAAIDLTSRVSQRIPLRRPLVSANMDTVTRAAMATVLAEEGGIGFIDRGFRLGDIEPQVTEVSAVKRTQHGVIADPHTIAPDRTIADALRVMEQTRVGTLAVVDGAHHLLGLLTQRDVRFVGRDLEVSERMTPFDRLVVHTGPIALEAAERVMADRKVKKLPLVSADRTLLGLITSRDLVTHRRLPFATRDDHGRLRVGAAIGATGDYLERAVELTRVGADLIVIDIAHGHSVVMERAIEQVRKRCGGIELVAGNVGTADGARFLLDRGVNGIKVGIGPGGGCTTRMTTNFGVPQLAALVECRLAIGDRVPLIADGGVRRDGSIVLALLCGGETVMLGSALAGTQETPGDVVLKPVVMPESQKIVQVPFKVFRGMASIGAVRDRLDLEDADPRELEAIGAEGLEVSVPARGSARTVVQDMIKHVCSAVSYGGAETLEDMRRQFWTDPGRYLIKLSASARTESFDR